MSATTDERPAEATTDAEGTADGSELIYLDQIGMPADSWSADGVVLVGMGLPTTVTQRLAALGDVEVTDDLDRLSESAALLVSTRAPRAEVAAALASVADRLRCPVVAVAHTGGEATAVEIMRAGGNAVIAEGNEEAIKSLLAHNQQDGGLIDTYARHFGRTHARTGRGQGRDAATGLPDRSRFEERLAELYHSGEIPRVGYVRVLHFTAAAEVLSVTGLNLLRRRLAAQFRPAMRAFATELYALEDGDFALIGPKLSPNACEQLGLTLNRIAHSYAPGGTGPLEVAVGHAGAEAGEEIAPIKELAQRALQVAVVDRSVTVVGPEMLALGVSATTELEAATRILDEVELRGPYPPGHGLRCAHLASEFARELGYEGAARSAIELAAHLHHIGKIGLPRDAVGGPQGLAGELLEAYKSYPRRSAAYLAPTAGATVERAVRHHRENFDGSGFPDGLSANEIPLEARIVAVAHALEELELGGEAEEPARLQELAGTRLDPDLVEVAVPLFQRLRDSGEA